MKLNADEIFKLMGKVDEINITLVSQYNQKVYF